MFKRFLSRPWLHFILLGSCLFFLQRWLNPPPVPVVGPLTESRVEELKRQWFSTTGRPPEDAQLRAMLTAELDREILFREALDLEIQLYDPVVRQRLVRNMHFLRLGENKSEEDLFRAALRMELHLGDEVVKRRLIQVMEQLLLNRYPPVAPTEADLELAFEERREELRRPPRYTIEHLFFNRERAREADEILLRIRSENLSAAQAREFSSPFLPGYRFAAQSPAQLARNFGAGFVLNLETAGPVAGQWLGPVESTYGLHLVWVEAVEPSRDASLEEVAAQLQRDLELERRRVALREAVAGLRAHYEVIL
jgi:hypothetical protein